MTEWLVSPWCDRQTSLVLFESIPGPWGSAATTIDPSPTVSCERWLPIRRCSVNSKVPHSQSSASATSAYKSTGMTVDEGLERFVRMGPAIAESACDDCAGIETEYNKRTTETLRRCTLASTTHLSTAY